jgi:hypothetical protein
VFKSIGLDHEKNSYPDLKEKAIELKQKLIIVPFSYIWNSIKVDNEIDGIYDEKKAKYAYETVDYGSLYLNSLPTIISNKFAAEVKKQNYGSALVFDIDKLERFEDLYNESYLKGNQVKIEVKPKESDDYDDYDDYDDFPEVHTSILEKKDNEKCESNEKDKVAETEEIKDKNSEKEVDALSESL